MPYQKFQPYNEKTEKTEILYDYLSIKYVEKNLTMVAKM